jgi:hypothetical protein
METDALRDVANRHPEHERIMRFASGFVESLGLEEQDAIARAMAALLTGQAFGAAPEEPLYRAGRTMDPSRLPPGS